MVRIKVGLTQMSDMKTKDFIEHAFSLSTINNIRFPCD
jgi:hypothetical protein